ncbi:probable metal-nicotianamine transporter YSL6 [Ricinus communis]|uniref:probable metal-nicotianamine transporter YSL6 n=1 Tax=Ricinus communis TaxID=3988 RepID=UPI00201A54ED|nr:probable metal-nicotianamine transporter YSL6 [Ricinus communis]XP_015580349.2 probable metal-nicotianamine transporter YSL6 [Ricinus communis]
MAAEHTAVPETLQPLIPSSQSISFKISDSVPEWTDQITFRGLVVSALLGTVFCILVHRLSLATGIIPSANIAAALVSFFVVKIWTGFISKFGFSNTPFTRQENTIIQTCIVACYGLAASGGFGTYLLAMDEKIYELTGVDYPGNRSEDVKNPGLGWMVSFLFVVSFLGLFSLVALRKVMILDYKLTYPSGTATAILINSFHTSKGAELAEKQVSYLGKYFTFSFCWSCFKWFFSGVDDSCGFDHFPSLGLTLFKYSFYFDFSPSLVGCGLICPHQVNCSILLGAIIFQGFLLPFISKQSGYWYSASLHDSDLKGLGGYKVIMSVSLILGDGLYNLIKTVTITLKKVHNSPRQDGIPVSNEESSRQLVEQNGRNDIFLKDRIPSWFAACGFMIVTIISAMTIPIIFPQLKWYVVLISCAIAPIFAFCNSYGTGLTDMSMLSTYGKIGIFIIASLVGRNGGVISGLAACGAIVTSAATAADLMQDFRTAYLTLSSPKAMFIGQLAGTTMGCVIAPLTFWLFWTAFDVGSPNGPYPAPYAILFRQMAILGISGFSELPKYSLVIFCSLLVLALIMNVLRDVLPLKLSRYIPIPMAMAIPVFVGANFAIDMFIGTALSFFWERRNQKDADDYVGAVASGLICGDGLWTIPSAILSISRINPPVCMNFRPSLRR